VKKARKMNNCNVIEIPKCPQCGEDVGKYSKYCSSKCSNSSSKVKEKKRQSYLAKYGVENPSQSGIIQKKIRQTSIEKYGSNHFLASKEVIEKREQNNKDKYGVANVFQLEEIKDKIKETNLKNLGVENPAQSDKIRKKIKRLSLDKFYLKLLESSRLRGKVEILFPIEDYNGTKDNWYVFKCKECNKSFNAAIPNGRVPRCPQCYASKSRYESEIEEWFSKLNIGFKKNDKTLICPLEVDFYLPDYKLGLEFNGLYYHSELSGGKGRNYHLNKTLKCADVGVQLLHIFEDEWVNKTEIVKDIIKSKLKLIDDRIYARNCEVKQVDNADSFNFLFENHLQEPIYGKLNLGLYYNNELVYLIVVSKSRFRQKSTFELIRSCPKLNLVVIGGFSKLIGHAIENCQISPLVSYVDRRLFDGRSYKDWNFLGFSDPGYWYTDAGVRESRIKYQKHKIVETEEDKNLTEWQIMQLRGYDRIWDCGNLIFSKS
jgi:hypothetical protein